MVFTSPSWVPELPRDPPDSISLDQFIFSEKYGRRTKARSRHPYQCDRTGQSYAISELEQRVDHLARALSKRLDIAPNEGTEWEKVIAVFSVNTVDYIAVHYAVHRLSGIVTPASTTHSAAELEHQLTSANAKAIFTCVSLLHTALEAAEKAGVSDQQVFLLPTPDDPIDQIRGNFLTLEDLIEEGSTMPTLEPLQWTRGQGSRQVAYLCYSSGTSGLPKAVMISHRNVIANILQYTTYESVSRRELGIDTQTVLGLLPFSHIYGLIVVTHANTYRGDSVVVISQFKLERLLQAIQRFQIELLYLVPPIIISFIRNAELCARYDLSSVRYVYSGAAPLGTETVDKLLGKYPKWKVGQGYGMTETCTVVFSTSELDIDQGSSGSLMPGMKAKIISTETGEEILEHNRAGELLVQSPSVVLGYWNNAKATSETFFHDKDGRWIKTGDEGMIRTSKAGHEHLVILDRIKELIKVKGHQVAPAELEAHLLAHTYVADCAVVQVPDEAAGEVPRAYVVKSSSAANEGLSNEEVAFAIKAHVENHKARHKWLAGGVEFMDAIPKSPSGKILRRLLRTKEKEERLRTGSKL